MVHGFNSGFCFCLQGLVSGISKLPFPTYSLSEPVIWPPSSPGLSVSLKPSKTPCQTEEVLFCFVLPCVIPFYNSVLRIVLLGASAVLLHLLDFPSHLK